MVYQGRWNGTVIAESDDIVEVEGNAYFARSALKTQFFEESPTTSTCPWKGRAGYLTVLVGGQRNIDAAWTYLKPSRAAESIRDRVAFWRGVTVAQTNKLAFLVSRSGT